MTPKNLKKRSNSETADQSPPKKQKKQIAKILEPKEAESNGGEVAAAQTLTAKQRKRQASKNRKLAAIARIKEEGGIPKPLWPGKKDKKQKTEENGDKTGEEASKVVEKTVAKNRSPEDKLKAIQDKRAETVKLRKEKRQEVGQYKPEQVNLTADEIRLRIAEIKGRPEISKTAKRKLGVLIKKLAIEEGTAVAKDANKTENNVEENEDKSGVSKSVKRRRRRGKQGSTGVEGEMDTEEGDDPSKEKPVDIQSFEKKKQKQNVVAKKGGQQVVGTLEGKMNKKQKKGEQGPGTKTNNGKLVKKKVEESEEKEEEEEEEEEESEDEEEATEPEGQEESSDDDDEEEELDSSQQEGEEEDDDEEEEEEEEEEEDVKPKIVEKTVKKEEKSKGKKEQSQGQGVKRKLDQEESSDKKKRYILFVGNLPFDSKPEDVKAHFLTKVGEVSSVRIPTKPGTQVPRGFCYVEVSNEIDYEKGLSLHHTFLAGRRINVEYTLAGSKQVGKRQELVSKNQKLHAMRKAGQLAGSQKHDQKRSVRRFKKREQEREPK